MNPYSIRLRWDEWVAEGGASLRKDPLLGPLVREQPTPAVPVSNGAYPDLIDAVVGQQLSVKAAAAIKARLVETLGPDWKEPRALLALSHEELRAAGLSNAKVRYVRGIAEAVSDRRILLAELEHQADDTVIAELVQLPGVGPWTAEMMLIFSFCRPDVFSVGDLGIRNAVARVAGVDRDDRAAIHTIAEAWSPYRSLACRYLWNSLENTPLEAPGSAVPGEPGTPQAT